MADERKYHLVYRLNVDMHAVPEGKTADEVRAEDLGGADALFVASVLYPKDGGLSIVFVSKDGRTDEEMTDDEVFKIWTMLAHRLSESNTLTSGKRNLCVRVDELVREAILGSRAKG